MIMKYITLLLIILPPLCKADSLYTGAWSYHAWDAKYVSNYEHNLIAYEYKGIVLGEFKNSYDDDTILLVKQFEFYSENNVKFSIDVGITHGYKDCVHVEGPEENDKGVSCFAAAAELSYTKYKIQPTIMVLGNATVVTIKWEIK